MIKNVTFLRLKKVDGSRFFWSNFVRFWVYRTPLGFIEKQAPQKALCLGPDPPPENLLKKVDFYWFLPILGPSIEPEKASLKSASTANPPSEVKFMTFLIIRDPIYQSNVFLASFWNCFHIILVLGIVSLLFHFLVVSRIGYSSFSGSESSLGILITCWLRY
jgi:hypothetical protein